MGIVNRIDARMQLLERELNPLRSNWVGEAQQAYTVAKTRWEGAIREMRDLLLVTSRQVTMSNAEYRDADARGARSFGI
jgi:WXG100 family type VII secretion target